eukprot:6436409-Pyramimonas_sp.AAC.1
MAGVAGCARHLRPISTAATAPMSIGSNAIMYLSCAALRPAPAGTGLVQPRTFLLTSAWPSAPVRTL